MAARGFHARLSCTGKSYLYRVWNSSAPCVFDRKYVSRVPEPLDIEAMREASNALLGEHDFAAFAVARGKKSTVRRIGGIEISREGPEVRFLMSGNGFLYNMARIITGTLLEVGRGCIEAGEVSAVLASRDRRRAGPTAEAKGLCLWETRYE